MTVQFGSFTGAGWAGWPAAAAMELAGRDYRAGDREAAARRCHEIVARDAWHFEALYLLGVVCLECSQFEDAVTYLDRATRVRPDAEAVSRFRCSIDRIQCAAGGGCARRCACRWF